MKVHAAIIVLLSFGCGSCASVTPHQRMQYALSAEFRSQLEDVDIRTYCAKVREMVNQQAASSLTSEGIGSVTIKCMISARGQLLGYDIDQEKTKAPKGVIKDAVAALKASAPFPPFPDTLKKKKKLQFLISLNYQ